MNRPRRTAPPALMLVLTTLFWGLSFPLVKNWQEAAVSCPGGAVVASFTLIALRMLLSLPLLLLVQPRLLTITTRREHRIGLAVGLAFFAGFSLQVLGMAYTTPALSGFFTSLCSVWTPLLIWGLFRVKSPRLTIFGIVLAVGGAAVLGVHLDEKQALTLAWGDALTLAASLFFAAQMILLDRLGRSVCSGRTSFAMLAEGGILALIGTVFGAANSASGLGGWLEWTAQMLRQPAILIDLALLTVLATALAFHWMNSYQPQVGASRAALIYFLEPVFAAGFSVLWGHDALTPRLVLGGLLILAGNGFVMAFPTRRGQISADGKESCR